MSGLHLVALIFNFNCLALEFSLNVARFLSNSVPFNLSIKHVLHVKFQAFTLISIY